MTHSTQWRFLLIIPIISVLSLIFGCTFTKPRPIVQKELDLVNPKQMIQMEKPPSSPGPPPFTEKLAPLSNGLVMEKRLYSMTFNQAPLGEVVRALVSSTDLSLSVESGINLSRPVTVNLKNSTLPEALNTVVIKGAGYAWKAVNSCIEIKRFEERIYTLDYLDMPGNTDIEVGGDMLASSVEDSGVTGKYEVKATRESKNTDVWAGVKNALEGLKSPDGILQINRAAGIIYMADTPRRIATMVRFLDSMSESLHRQIFIEAKIMEVTLNDSYKFGVDWSNLNVILQNETELDSVNISFNQGGTLLLSDTDQFSAVIDFLHGQGDVTALSNPHLSVTNGQSAIMTVGYQFPYADISGVNRDEETKVVTFDTSIKRTVLGLQMGITAQISSKGIITLHIVPTVTRMQTEVDVVIPTGVAETQAISNPVIDLQELATTVRVREGQSVVLAGLISQVKQIQHEGLPWLSKIPFLGYFFKHLEEIKDNRELVIIITPYLKEVS
ncbi:MAG: hypothetical protein SVY10_07955 [Thermodesulfobacteriota bacterium]|nr:hypothetical protein [Thermodesulfobacteriota bacterium]